LRCTHTLPSTCVTAIDVSQKNSCREPLRYGDRSFTQTHAQGLQSSKTRMSYSCCSRKIFHGMRYPGSPRYTISSYTPTGRQGEFAQSWLMSSQGATSLHRRTGNLSRACLRGSGHKEGMSKASCHSQLYSTSPLNPPPLHQKWRTANPVGSRRL
jgi:hypothetical protein